MTQQLTALVVSIRQLSDDKVHFSNQFEQQHEDLVRRIFEARLRRIQAHLVLLSKRAAELVATQDDLARRARLTAVRFRSSPQPYPARAGTRAGDDRPPGRPAPSPDARRPTTNKAAWLSPAPRSWAGAPCCNGRSTSPPLAKAEVTRRSGSFTSACFTREESPYARARRQKDPYRSRSSASETTGCGTRNQPNDQHSFSVASGAISPRALRRGGPHCPQAPRPGRSTWPFSISQATDSYTAASDE